MRRFYTIICLFLSFVFAAGLLYSQDQQKTPAVKEAALGETRNVHSCGSLFLAGQPTKEDIQTIKEKGIKRVITLRTEGEIDWDEESAVKDSGLEFVEIPVRSPDSLTDDVLDRVRKLLKGADETPTLLHCGSANRVGAVWLAHRVLDQGVALETALEEAKTIGLRSRGLEAKSRDYVRRHAQPTKSEKSVRPGINERFLDPELDVDEWVNRFEGESREIYKNRRAIVDALNLKPGMRVADIGAGTGFFTKLMAERVGDTGWVYAVEISPRFVEHISAMAAKADLSNVTPLLCADNSVRLPEDSIDMAFICDTYHHFEYPKSTLASIHRALRDNGALVVIDFERIPGKSREFILDHVRAGKETFRSEIEAAGFEFVEEMDVKGLEENYFLRFRKK